MGGTRTGRLPLNHDVDTYRFSLAAEEHLRFDVEVPSDGGFRWLLARDSTTIAVDGDGVVGAHLSYDALLPGGDYVLVLTPVTASQGRYRLSLTREDPLTVADDQEPNDAVGFARPLPSGGVVSGNAMSSRDQDWYVIPPLTQAGALELRTSGKVVDLALSDGMNTLQMTQASPTDPRVSGSLPAGVPLYLEVIADGDYTVSVGDPASDPTPVALVPLGESLSLALDSPAVAAFWPTGQVIHGTISITGDPVAGLALDAVTSDASWSVEPAASSVDVAAGAPTTVPVTVRVQPDATADVPVMITVRARDAAGRQATAMAKVIPDRDAQPVSSAPVWAVPDALIGGLDAASVALGAAPVPSLDATSEAALHDALAYAGGPLDLRIGSLPVSLTVDLAGDNPVPVAGTVLDPLAGSSTFWGIPRRFQLLLSDDGSTWQPALTGELQPLPVEQAFVLPSAVTARFARLEIDSTWGGAVGELVLGEWKVVVSPGVAIGPTPLYPRGPGSGGARGVHGAGVARQHLRHDDVVGRPEPTGHERSQGDEADVGGRVRGRPGSPAHTPGMGGPAGIGPDDPHEASDGREQPRGSPRAMDLTRHLAAQAGGRWLGVTLHPGLWDLGSLPAFHGEPGRKASPSRGAGDAPGHRGAGGARIPVGDRRVGW